MADEIRLTVMKVVERRMLIALCMRKRSLLTLRLLNSLWLALNQDAGISLGNEAGGDKKVGWGRGARLPVGLSHI